MSEKVIGSSVWVRMGCLVIKCTIERIGTKPGSGETIYFLDEPTNRSFSEGELHATLEEALQCSHTLDDLRKSYLGYVPSKWEYPAKKEGEDWINLCTYKQGDKSGE